MQFFIATLLISVLRDRFRLKLIKFRRPLGLLTFFYVVLHLGIWIGLDLQFRWAEAWADILKRPYITIGMVGFALLIPLAVTSNGASVRKMGAAAWRKLHKLTYLAVILGGVHYIWLVKGIQLEPLIYMAIILGLLALRLPKKRRRVVA